MISVKLFISTSGDTSQGYWFTDNDFKSMKFSNQLMDTSFDINPTIIEQYAEIEFKDKNHRITDLVLAGVLEKDLKVYVYINNILTYTYLTSSWEIQAQSTTVKLYCNDPVKKLENCQTRKLEPSNRTLAYMFTTAFSWTNYTFTYEDLECDHIAQSIILKNTYIPYKDVLTLLKELCVTGFFRIYWKKDRFVIARCF